MAARSTTRGHAGEVLQDHARGHERQLHVGSGAAAFQRASRRTSSSRHQVAVAGCAARPRAGRGSRTAAARGGATPASRERGQAVEVTGRRRWRAWRGRRTDRFSSASSPGGAMRRGYGGARGVVEAERPVARRGGFRREATRRSVAARPLAQGQARAGLEQMTAGQAAVDRERTAQPAGTAAVDGRRARCPRAAPPARISTQPGNPGRSTARFRQWCIP